MLMVTIMWFIPVFSPLSLLLICCSFGFGTIAYFILHSLMQKQYEIYHTCTGKLSRRLGFFERYFLTIASGSNIGYVNTVLLLESKVKLDRDHVKKALLMLSKRFPLLRMRVALDRFNQPCFEQKENPQSLDFQQMVSVDSRKWLDGFHTQINCAPFNIDRGPLWRVTLLKETCETRGKENVYKNALLFTFHHVICDARSIFEFKSKLVEFLGLLYNGDAIEVETLPFPPPIERVTRHLTKPNIWERFLLPVILNCRKVKAMIRKPKLENLYLSAFPPPSSYSLAHRTYVIPRNLTKEETAALISCSKVHKCTVHGAVTAATHLAMSRIIDAEQKRDRKTPLLIDSCYTVDIRKECEPKIGREEFGLYSVFDSLQIAVKETASFWEFARVCTNEVHNRIDSGKHRNALTFLQCVDIPSVWALGSYETKHGYQKEIFNLTNLGVLSIDREGKSPYKFSGSYLAVQTGQVCYLMGHNLVTIDDKLYWTMEYSPEITTKSEAEKIVDLSLSILLNACVSVRP